MAPSETIRSEAAGIIAVCGNPNCGKTTIFNHITGLNQQVGNYSGVTVERVAGHFSLKDAPRNKYTLIDVPGTYSLSSFTPDEYIAAAALFGNLPGEPTPDVIIAVLDATNLERSFYFLFQLLQIGKPIVVAINMTDLAERRGLHVNTKKISSLLGGIPVIPVIGNKGTGINYVKEAAVKLIGTEVKHPCHSFDADTEALITQLTTSFPKHINSRAHALRIIFDYDGPAERSLFAQEGEPAKELVRSGREQIKKSLGALSVAEIQVLTGASNELYQDSITQTKTKLQTKSDRIDKVLLHPFFGPVFLIAIMLFVFQSIFSWAEPFMTLIDEGFGSLAGLVESGMAEGPLRSLITDGLIGGVGSVLVFIPQIVILFLFIALLEDSGYMPRAAFLVDRMFRWCGLSGKSFIPMLSSFACAVPGIMATRTIEDRKLRLITIMVAPLMTCSARLPVYAIMISAFIPYQTYFGVINLQGLTLALLYLLGIIIAVTVSFILSKTLYKAERGTFMMELPSYKVPTVKSVFIRVYNRARSFIVRAGTVIMAITIVIWALSYYPRLDTDTHSTAQSVESFEEQLTVLHAQWQTQFDSLVTATPDKTSLTPFTALMQAENQEQGLEDITTRHPELIPVVTLYESHLAAKTALEEQYQQSANVLAGEQIRQSYFGIIGRSIEPVFEPLGWDWKITMSVLASFPAREVIIAVLGTIYNLGTEVDETSSSLVDKMRLARWESGDKVGQQVFSIPVALSIMVFFALCSQCGATLVTIKQETKRWIYSIVVFVYMTSLAYVAALIVYQIGSSFI